jgi:type VI protein secretion system component Hcp
MADANKTDLVMLFVLDGQPVWGECALDVWSKDTLMTEFKPADYDNYSNFFEVKSFDFKIALKEDDQTGAATSTSTAATGPFARWRSASNSEYKKIRNYPLEVDTFSFTRAIDSASPIFFQSCCQSRTFDKAILVKRLSQGGPADAPLPAAAYMRIELTDVLITNISWDDGDMVEEKCDCLCRGITVTYRQQGDDGRILASGGPPAVWPNPNDDRTKAVRGNTRRI